MTRDRETIIESRSCSCSHSSSVSSCSTPSSTSTSVSDSASSSSAAIDVDAAAKDQQLQPPLPHWNINISPRLHTVHCPPYLLSVSAKDLATLKTLDRDYHILTWPEVRDLVLSNRLQEFQRIPSHLRRYLAFIQQCKKDYGGVMEYVLKEKLEWEFPLVPSGQEEGKTGGPGEVEGNYFQRKENWKVVGNEWPYGIEEDIVHLVVWMKRELEEVWDRDLGREVLSQRARSEVEQFVNEVFGRQAGSAKVLWFRNWRGIKSVGTVEHFHVLLYQPNPDIVKEITGEDPNELSLAENFEVGLDHDSSISLFETI